MGHNPYENRYEAEITNAAFREKYAYVEVNAEERKDESVSTSITGRIKFLRLMGKAAFAKLEDESGVLQVYYSKNELGEWFARPEEAGRGGRHRLCQRFPLCDQDRGADDPRSRR